VIIRNLIAQLFLRADVGIDYVDFFNLLYVIASNRLLVIRGDDEVLGQRGDDALRRDGEVQGDGSQRIDNVPVDDDCCSDGNVDDDAGVGVGDAGFIRDCSTSRLAKEQISDRRASGDEANHRIYDLFRISEILVEMTQRPDVFGILEIGRERMLCPAVDLLERVRAAVEGRLKT